MVTAQRAEPYGLTSFIDDLEAAVREEKDPAAIIARCKPLLEQLLQNPKLLTEEQKAVATDGKSTGCWLFQAPHLTVRAVVFPEAKPTPVHDHLTWGMVGVYEGIEREERFQRLDDGSREDYAEIAKLGATLYKPGQVTTFVPPDDIHTVEAVSPVKSVSIHVYGADMETIDRHRFDLATGQVLPFRSQSRR